MADKPYAIVFTPNAKQDLAWLRERQINVVGPVYARRVIAGILKKIELLSSFPQIGPKDPWLDFLGMDHRYLIFEIYKINYIVRESDATVFITNITDARQNPDTLRTQNS